METKKLHKFSCEKIQHVCGAGLKKTTGAGDGEKGAQHFHAGFKKTTGAGEGENVVLVFSAG